MSEAATGATMAETGAFKAGMRRLAGAVCIVTSRHLGNPTGLVATALCSLSADPPTLVACINRSANAHESISRSGGFCVNDLAASQVSIAHVVSNPEDRGSRFSVGSWSRLPTGRLSLESALACFDCAVERCVDVTTHSILIGSVRHVHLGTLQPSLLYMNGQYLTGEIGQPL